MDISIKLKLTILLLFSCIGIGFLVLIVFEKVAQHYKLFDIPNHRSSHQTPVLRGAGLGFAITSILCIAAAYSLNLVSESVFISFALGASFITFIGFLDDILNLRASIRLSSQLGVAIFTLWVATNHFNTPLEVKFLPFDSPLLSIFFGLLFITWMVNLYNFMDGVDGIAGTQAIAIGLLSALLCVNSHNFSLALTYTIVAAAVIPFQIRNWHPARIFMGDSGAYFLGFAFACLAILGKVSYDQSLVAHTTLMGAFICDATLTLLIRFKNSHHLFEGHRSHGFHKLLTVFDWSPKQISLFYTCSTVLWFFPCALLAQKYMSYSVPICLASYIPFIAYLAYVKVGIEKASESP